MAAPMVPVPGNPGIYTRGSRWVVKYTYRGRQHKPSFSNLKAAKAFKAKLTLGDVEPETNQRFDQYAEKWIAAYRGDAGTRTNYARSLAKEAIPFFGRLRIRDIKPTDIRGFVKDLEDKGVNPPSIQRHLKPLRALLAAAHADGDISRNPAVGLKLELRRAVVDVEADGKAKAMSEAQAEQVIAALPQQHRLFFQFLLQTGLRISEALGLQWRDLELQQRLVHVQRQRYRGTIKQLKPRNAKRRVPLSQSMVAALLELRMALGRPPDDAPVWCAVLRGPEYAPLDDHTLRRALRATAEPLGLGWVTPHVSVTAARPCCSTAASSIWCRSRGGWATASPATPWTPTAI